MNTTLAFVFFGIALLAFVGVYVVAGLIFDRHDEHASKREVRRSAERAEREQEIRNFGRSF